MEEVTTLFDSDEAEYEYMKEQEARRLKAEEEKQIEETARQNCHIKYQMKNYKTCKECYETNYCACRVYEVCRNLYNAGYRKQSEGEWVYHECVSSYDGAKSGYSCSRCDAFVDENVFDTDEFHKGFCGNCGAKMKGV